MPAAAKSCEEGKKTALLSPKLQKCTGQERNEVGSEKTLLSQFGCTQVRSETVEVNSKNSRLLSRIAPRHQTSQQTREHITCTPRCESRITCGIEIHFPGGGRNGGIRPFHHNNALQLCRQFLLKVKSFKSVFPRTGKSFKFFGMRCQNAAFWNQVHQFAV